MILTAHQPAYLPWLGLFHKIALADKYIYFDQVQYVSREWINRNYIKSQNGPVLLTVPILSSAHFDKKISDMLINNNLAWNKKHWKSIELSYKKSKNFNRYAGFFYDLYLRNWTRLSELNYFMLKFFLNELEIKTIVEKAENYDFKGKGSELVLDMCIKSNAGVYIFGSQGKNYSDDKQFKNNNVKTIYQNYNHPVYKQLHGNFKEGMSILDLLMNEGSRSLDIIMSNNIGKELLK